MKPTVSVSQVDKSTQLRAQLASLRRKQVLVGVPEDKTDRRDGAVSNAQLVYLHTHGSPMQHIPARPIIEPAIEAPDNKAMIANQLGAAAKAVLGGQAVLAKQSLQKAGMLGRNAALRWFTDPRNHWAALSQRTIERKESDRPLIDTGQLRRSITFVVEE